MYRKELYVFEKDKPRAAVVRNYTEQDFDELIQIQAESFPPPFPSELWWNREQLTNHVTLFPEGAICVEVEGVLAGSMTGLRVTFDPAHPEHKWEEITDNGYIRNHEPDGDTLYIVDICIRPSHRKLGLGQLMMQAMYELVVYRGLLRLLGGGRMPGYGRHADEWKPEEYVERVVAGEVKDPVITFLMRCGRTPVQVVANYLEDEESRNYATLMEWKNPFLRG
ncbi:GNAT family N-acetyltransferase [Brevibacillus choshinensis]|uniref:GNAT family N-acetyltransferase n=1 Tax=Brevibacillus choshinensis TaxID=54911 RepID=UPI002E217A6A|nr:GNAT family N-acetyltransferase [Brevibacillus choshinensis]MED4783097.1 GNAT family N-acetyltransferase [Brevibacillus choshinensis]